MCLLRGTDWIFKPFIYTFICSPPHNTHTHTHNNSALNTNTQCTDNVILRHVLLTTVTVEKQYYLLRVCVFSLRHPSCNTHAPYYHLRPARLYSIPPHYHKIHDFRKNVIEYKMCVLIVSATFVLNFSHSEEN